MYQFSIVWQPKCYKSNKLGGRETLGVGDVYKHHYPDLCTRPVVPQHKNDKIQGTNATTQMTNQSYVRARPQATRATP